METLLKEIEDTERETMNFLGGDYAKGAENAYNSCKAIIRKHLEMRAEEIYFKNHS